MTPKNAKSKSKPKAKTNLNEPSTEPVNFYTLKSVQKFAPKSHNPFFDVHNISLPFRTIVIGASGSGKSNFLLNLISVTPGTWEHIYIYTKENETLYDYLQSVIDESLLTIKYGNLDEFRVFDDEIYKSRLNTLVIFDDMVNESKKEQVCINELYIRGRKMGVSMCYLTQSYFSVPKMIRSQCNYFFILKVSGLRDLRLILSEFALSADIKQLYQMYRYCCENGGMENFMLIDLNTDSSKTFRKNFTEYLT